MKYFGTGAALVAAGVFVATAVAAQPLPVQKFPYKSGPVTITSCTLNENKSNSTVTNNSLRINFFPNEQARTLTSITFRVRYAGTPVTITDSGTFAYNAPITHQFDQLGGHAWAGASPEVCRVLTATFAGRPGRQPEIRRARRHAAGRAGYASLSRYGAERRAGRDRRSRRHAIGGPDQLEPPYRAAFTRSTKYWWTRSSGVSSG